MLSPSLPPPPSSSRRHTVGFWEGSTQNLSHLQAPTLAVLGRHTALTAGGSASAACGTLSYSRSSSLVTAAWWGMSMATLLCSTRPVQWPEPHHHSPSGRLNITHSYRVSLQKRHTDHPIHFLIQLGHGQAWTYLRPHTAQDRCGHPNSGCHRSEHTLTPCWQFRNANILTAWLHSGPRKDGENDASWTICYILWPH